MKKWANILLAVWLVLTGLVRLGGIRFSKSGTFAAALAVVVGILFLMADRSERLWARMGTIFLGAWLLSTGLMSLLHIQFSGSDVIMAAISIAAGVLILIQH